MRRKGSAVVPDATMGEPRVASQTKTKQVTPPHHEPRAEYFATELVAKTTRLVVDWNFLEHSPLNEADAQVSFF